MAVNLGTAYVTVKPSTKGFIKTLASEAKGAGEQSGNNFTSSFSNIVKGSAIFSVVNSALNKVGNAFASTLSAGISRYDTMKTFPTIMKNLGYSSDDAAVQVERLSKGVRGLPTSLSDITNLTTQVAPLTKSLSEATDVSLAFNNMLVASGKPMADQQRAMQQYTQALAKGKPDYLDWRTMMEVMPGQLNQVAKKMLGAEANAQTLGDALKNGKISMQEFNDAIVDMNNNGFDGFSSFATQAQENSKTVQTGIANIQNAFARFWETVFKKIDGNDAVVNALNGISKAIDGLGEVIGVTIGALLTFGGAIGDVISKLNEMGGVPLVVATLIPTFISLWAVIRIGKNLIGKLVSNIGSSLPSVLQKSSKRMKSFGTGLDSVGQKAGKSVGQLLGVAAVISSIGASIWLASNGFATLAGALTQLADKGEAGVMVLAMAGGTLVGLTAILATLTPTMASAAVPMFAIGGAIAIMSLGFSVLVLALTQLAGMGPAGIAVLAIAGGLLMGLIVTVGILGPALSASAVPILLVGTGIAILAGGVSILVWAISGLIDSFTNLLTMLPTVSEYGLQAAGNFLALGGALVVFGIGAGIAGIGAGILGVGLGICAIPMAIIAGCILIAGVGMNMFGQGAVLAANGVSAMAPFLLILVGAFAGLAGTGFLAAAGIGMFALAVGGAAIEIGLITWIYENFARAIETAGYWADSLWHSLDGIAGASGWAASNLNAIQGAVDGTSSAMQTLSGAADGMGGAFQNMASGSTVAASGFMTLMSSVMMAAAAVAVAMQTMAGQFNSLIGIAINTVESIKSAFANMQLHIPSPTLGAMPHFKMSGKFNAVTGEVPTINVDWYAKGGVFSSPQIIGVGDASSPEIVSAEDTMRSVFKSVLGEQKQPMQVNQTINTNDPALAAAVVVSKLRHAF